jgi:release factor glutamine methyltransferase
VTPVRASSALVARLRAAGCVFAEEEAALLEAEAPDSQALEAWVVRRVAGEPLEQIVGWAEFAGLRVKVAPGVFVPRRRSELLAHQVVRRAAQRAIVVELCAGVAAIATAASRERPDLEVFATEIDPVAVQCARENLGPERVFLGDLYAALPTNLRGRVDVVVANAPYVPTDEIELMPREARDHEPLVALDGGADGLDVHRRILARLGEWLAPDGQVLIEISPAQAPVLVALLAGAGMGTDIVRDDERDATAVRGWSSTTNSRQDAASGGI